MELFGFGIGGSSNAPTAAAAATSAPFVVPPQIVLEPDDPQKEARTAYGAAVLARLAYENDASVIRGELTRLGFDDIKLYGWDLRGSTQVIVARKGDVVAVVFRGTQEGSDIYTDILSLNPEDDPKLTGNEVQDYRRFEGSKVHRGFRDALAEVWDPDPDGKNGQRLKAAGQKSLLSTLQFEADRPDKPNTRFIFTGHSLGAALATHAAAVTSVQNPARSSRTTMLGKIAGVYTFGSPKVGNATYVAAFDRALGSVTKPAQHHTDVVRSLPPGPSYQHVAAENTVRLAPRDAANPPSPIASHSMDGYVTAEAERAQAEEQANGPSPRAALHRVDAFDRG